MHETQGTSSTIPWSLCRYRNETRAASSIAGNSPLYWNANPG